MKIKKLAMPVEFINFKIDIDIDVRITELATFKDSTYRTGYAQVPCDLWKSNRCDKQANFKIEIAEENIGNKFLSRFIEENNIRKTCINHKKYLGEYKEDVLKEIDLEKEKGNK